MNSSFYRPLKLLVLYSGCAVVNGVVKSEIILSILDTSIRDMARISSYFSVILGALFAVVLIALVGVVTWYGAKYLDSKQKITAEGFGEAMASFILILLMGEGIKLIFTGLLLPDEVKHLSVNDELINQLKETDWFMLNKYFGSLLLIAGSVYFGTTLRQETTLSQKTSLKITAILLFCLFLINVN